jgi:superfamily II RNA helicase
LLALPQEKRTRLIVELESLINATAHTTPSNMRSTRLKPKNQKAKARPSKTFKPRTSEPLTGPAVTTAGLLEGIGIPSPKEFKPDLWQEEAIDYLTTSDVIVSVPTGSGKTYVAIEAMRRTIDDGQTIIYTSPLKALSNTKLTEFSHIFGTEKVGILTGDRRDNPKAPILIMTTEILRNLLYDAASGEIDMRLDTLGLVILDESQFIADPERGVVWEETIIFCPTQSRLLLLSASIGNPSEISSWISSIRSRPCHLIHHRNRSVPLRAAYLDPSGKLSPLFHNKDITNGTGFSLNSETKHLFNQYEDQTLGTRYRK